MTDSEIVYMHFPRNLLVGGMTYKDKLVFARIYPFWQKKKDFTFIDIKGLSEQLDMPHDEFRRALKHLEELQVLSVKVKGIPKKCFINVNYQTECSKETLPPQDRNCPIVETEKCDIGQSCQKSNIAENAVLIQRNSPDQYGEKRRFNRSENAGSIYKIDISKNKKDIRESENSTKASEFSASGTESKAQGLEQTKEESQEQGHSLVLGEPQIENNRVPFSAPATPAEVMPLQTEVISTTEVAPVNPARPSSKEEVIAYFEQCKQRKLKDYPCLQNYDPLLETETFLNNCITNEWKRRVGGKFVAIKTWKGYANTFFQNWIRWNKDRVRPKITTDDSYFNVFDSFK